MVPKSFFVYLYGVAMWVIIIQVIDISMIFRSIKKIFKPRQMEHRFIRRRQLLEEENDNVTTAPQNNFTFPPTYLPYVPNNAVSPSNGELNVNEGTPPEHISSTDLIPAVVVAVSSSVLFGAAILYAADLRDRLRHEHRMEEFHRRRREYDDTTSSVRQTETIASTNDGNRAHIRRGDRAPHSGVHPIQHSMKDECPRTLRHFHQPEYVEEFSICAVSTMTSSMAPFGGGSLHRVDSDGLEASIDITELSDSHRVSLGTNLASLIDLSRLQTVAQVRGDGGKISPAIQITTFESQDEDESNALECTTNEDENESGWTSSLGNSDSFSSDMSMSVSSFLNSQSPNVTESSSLSSSHGGEKSIPSLARDSQGLYLCGVGCLHDSTQLKNAVSTSGLDNFSDTQFDEVSTSGEGNDNICEEDLLCDKDNKFPRTSRDTSSCTDDDEEEGGSSQQEYVREIYFVPVSIARKTIDLGIQFSESTTTSGVYPCVSSVSKDSPLVDRVFTGDTILAVNNEDIFGLHSSEVAKMMFCCRATELDDADDQSTQEEESVNVVKLTIMSQESDGSDSSESFGPSTPDDDDDSFDTGDAETAIEM